VFYFFFQYSKVTAVAFIIKYLISNKYSFILSWFLLIIKKIVSWFLLILRETMTLHNVFIQTLGEWVKQFLLLKDLFPACQMSFHPLEYLPQTFKQKSNTCVPLCLVCKFGSSVTLLSNSFVTFFHVVWLSIFTRTPLCILNLPHFISLH
jgi:hypothetical protein